MAKPRTDNRGGPPNVARMSFRGGAARFSRLHSDIARKSRVVGTTRNLGAGTAGAAGSFLEPSRFYATVLFCCSLLVGCGYHVAGHYSNLPANLQTIAIPALKNDTTRYRIEQRMTQYIVTEFLERTKFHVVQNPANADAVLHGEVVSVATTPMLFNATTGEVTMMLVTVHARVSLVDNRTRKLIYHANDMVFKQEYQISTDVQSFFQEQDPAFDRMSRDFAARVVSSVLEGF